MSVSESSFTQALAAAEAGDLDLAEAAFRRVIGDNPEHLEGLRGLAGVLRRQDRAGEAASLEAQAAGFESAYLAKLAARLIKLGQHDAAARPLARALDLDPGNPDALNLSACLARVRGDFESARALYARAHAAAPEDQNIAAALQVMNGQPLEAEAEDDMPVIVPFARLGGFLEAEQRAQAMEFARDNLSVFQQSHVLIGMDHAHDTSVRSSRVAMEPKPIVRWFKPRVKAALPQVFARLGCAPFKVAKIELQMTAHLDGDFYTVHNDNSHGSRHGHRSDGRRISFVYYFCREPKRFTGGGLRLFDTDLRKGAYRREVFSRVSPDDNSIVFFPSAAMHEVEMLRLESDDPADGRFTLNGWIHPAS